MNFTVSNLTTELEGYGYACVPSEQFSEFNIRDGSHLAIVGPDGEHRTLISAKLSSDIEEDTIRLDAVTRERVNAEPGDEVMVEPVALRDAHAMTIDVPEWLSDKEVALAELRRKLSGRALGSGERDSLHLNTVDRDVEFEVTEVVPDSFVSIRPHTDIRVAEEDDDPEAERSIPDVSFDDIGGLEQTLRTVEEAVEGALHPEQFTDVGIRPPSGVLLHGPPGTGKTRIARAVANETDAHFVSIEGPELFDKFFGESERKLREKFDEAREHAPAVLYIDELDAIGMDRDAEDSPRQSVVRQLLTVLDGLGGGDNEVVVLATTNRVDDLDPALRRPGRFDREVKVGLPSESAREEILAIHTEAIALDDDVDLAALAGRTQGFTGADLAALVQEATLIARRALDTDELSALTLSQADFEAALETVRPSGLREHRLNVPDVSWDDVGGQEEAKQTLRETVEWPQTYPEAFEAAALDPSTGILLHGPPGTGKTHIAKAVAAESECNFLQLPAPELLAGGPEAAIQRLSETFATAREHAPSVVFIDEFDAIAAARGPHGPTGVVDRLLTALDGLEASEDLTVIAATNRPDALDPAVTRPGRFDKQIEVGLPDEDARREILAIHTRDRTLVDVDLAALAARTDGFSGADLAGLCRQAARNAVRDAIESEDGDTAEVALRMCHFEAALDEVETDTADEVDAIGYV